MRYESMSGNNSTSHALRLVLRQALRLLALQAVTILAACAPVYMLNL